MEVMRVIREFFKKLQADLNIRIDANSLSYIRLMNHIKFLLLRLNNDEELQMDITEFTKEKFPFAYEQARVLCEQLSRVYIKICQIRSWGIWLYTWKEFIEYDYFVKMLTTLSESGTFSDVKVNIQ